MGKANYIKIIIWFLIVIMAVWFAGKIYHTIIVFSISALLAYLINPVVEYLAKFSYPFTKKKISRTSSLIIVYFSLVAVVSIISLISFPIILSQINSLVNILPERFGQLNIHYSRFQLIYKGLPENVKNIMPQILSATLSKTGIILGKIFQNIGIFLFNFISGTLLVIMALIIAFFILIQWENLKEKIKESIPRSWRNDSSRLNMEFNHIFGNFIKGTIILAILTSLINVFIFLILGVFWHPFQYSLIVSALNGLTSAVPYLGVIFTFIVGLVLGYIQTNSIFYGILIALLVLLANKIVDQIFYPKIMGDVIGVSPLFIIFAVFAGGELFGIWGMVIGIPIAAIIKTFLSYAHKKFLS